MANDYLDPPRNVGMDSPGTKPRASVRVCFRDLNCVFMDVVLHLVPLCNQPAAVPITREVRCFFLLCPCEGTALPSFALSVSLRETFLLKPIFRSGETRA